MEIQAATEIALTKLDVLGYRDEIPVCVAYRDAEGRETTEFPFPAALPGMRPVIRTFEGWKTDLSRITRWEDLPEAARRYVTFIEDAVGCPITYVSVGPERDSIIRRKQVK